MTIERIKIGKFEFVKMDGLQVIEKQNREKILDIGTEKIKNCRKLSLRINNY